MSCVTGFFNSVKYFGELPMLQVSGAHSFLVLKSIPLYGYNTFCLSIHLLKDICSPLLPPLVPTIRIYIAAMNIYIQVFCVDLHFHFSWIHT